MGWSGLIRVTNISVRNTGKNLAGPALGSEGVLGILQQRLLVRGESGCRASPVEQSTGVRLDGSAGSQRGPEGIEPLPRCWGDGTGRAPSSHGSREHLLGVRTCVCTCACMRARVHAPVCAGVQMCTPSQGCRQCCSSSSEAGGRGPSCRFRAGCQRGCWHLGLVKHPDGRRRARCGL